jgi:hypothetical protein
MYACAHVGGVPSITVCQKNKTLTYGYIYINVYIYMYWVNWFTYIFVCQPCIAFGPRAVGSIVRVSTLHTRTQLTFLICER